MTTSTDAPIPTPRPESSSGPAAKPRHRRFGKLTVAAVFILVAGLAFWHFGLNKARPRVAIVTSGEGPYWDRVIAGANEAARQNDVDLTVIRSKSDTTVQSKHIQDLKGKQIAGVAISPLDVNIQANLLADVATAMTLVTFDSDSPVSRRLCFVGTDNYAAGRMVGEAVQAAVPDGGEVVVCMGFPDKFNTLRRRQGVIDQLIDRPNLPQRSADPLDGPLAGPKYTIVATTRDDGNRQKATDVAAQALKDHPNIKCFVGLLSYSAPQIMEALKPAGKMDQVQIVGFDVDDRSLKAIEEGHVRATLMQDQFGCGFHAVNILANEARGNHSTVPLFQNYVLPYRLVTKDNLAAVRQDLARSGSAVPAAVDAASLVAPGTPGHAPATAPAAAEQDTPPGEE